MIQKMNEKNANLLTNWFGGLIGLPQILEGLGIAHASLVQVNDGYHFVINWFPESMSLSALATGVGMAAYGYIWGKKPKT